MPDIYLLNFFQQVLKRLKTMTLAVNNQRCCHEGPPAKEDAAEQVPPPCRKRSLVMCCGLECRASQLTGFHHHSSYLMSDCLWADKIKLQAWLIPATGVFLCLIITRETGVFTTYSG